MWSHLAINEQGREATGWQIAPDEPAFDPETERLDWQDGDWVVRELADDPPPVVDPALMRVTHKQFLDLLTLQEQIKLKAVQKTVDKQTSAEFVAPGNAPLQAFSVSMDMFEKSTMIELNHPQTQYAIYNIMVPLGIFTAPRAAQILSNSPPSGVS